MNFTDQITVLQARKSAASRMRLINLDPQDAGQNREVSIVNVDIDPI